MNAAIRPQMIEVKRNARLFLLYFFRKPASDTREIDPIIFKHEQESEQVVAKFYQVYEREL